MSTIPVLSGGSSLLEGSFRFAMKTESSASIQPFCPFQKLNISVIHFHKTKMLYLTVREKAAALLQLTNSEPEFLFRYMDLTFNNLKCILHVN